MLSLRTRIALGLAPCLTTAICLRLLHSGWGALLAYHLVIVLSLLKWRQVPLRSLHQGNWNWFGAAMCGGSLLAGPVIYLLLPWFQTGPLRTQLAQSGLYGVSWLLLIPYFSLINPVLEELFWRGLLHSRERNGWVFDLLFASYHLLVLPLFVKPPFVALAGIALVITSLLWRTLTTRSGGLLPALCCHVIADIAIMTAVCLR